MCCGAAYYVARQVKTQARLYTVLALFAGAWALVAAAIESRLLEPDRATALSDRAQDVASFVLVYSGAILAREDTTHKWMMTALWNSLPSLVHVPNIPGLKHAQLSED